MQSRRKGSRLVNVVDFCILHGTRLEGRSCWIKDSQCLNIPADAPLSASTNDKFHRWPFAKRVARVIASRTDLESIVIGINGAWGEGKTTVFNFIEEALMNIPHVVCFRFNPWRFPDENKLIRDFFQSLAGAVDKKLDKNHEKIGSFLSKYPIFRTSACDYPRISARGEC